MARTSSPRRFIFVDVLRSIAIAMALAAHAFNDFDVPGRLPFGEYVVLRSVTRAAAPSFIFMFGMMLELVYARRIDQNGLSAVVPRLVWRSLQCYFGYVATVFAGYVMGLFDLAHALQAAVFIFGGHHGNILKYYTVAILVAVPLLAFRHRLGLGAALALCLSPWVLSPLLDAVNAVHVGRFNRPLELFVHMVPYSLTFIGAGMLVGNSLRQRDRLLTVFYRHSTALLTVCALIVGLLMWKSSPADVYTSYLDYYEYRDSYHIGYYAIGLLQAGGLALLFFMLIPFDQKVLSSKSPLLVFGRCSLLSFTVGNIILNVLVGRVSVSPYVGIWIAIGYLVVVLLLVAAWERILQYVKAHPRLAGIMWPVELLKTHLVRPASALILHIARAGRRLADNRLPSLQKRLPL